LVSDVSSSLKDFVLSFIPRSFDSEVRNYVPLILFAAIVLLFALYAGRLLRSLLASLATALRHVKKNREEASRARSEKKSVMRNVKQLLKNRDFQPAAVLLESINELEGAADLYLKAGEHLSAARIYESLGNLEKAAPLYKEAGNNTKAADAFLKLGDRRSAAMMYENAGLLKKAAEIYEDSGNLEKAAELYEISFIEDTARAASSAGEKALKSGGLFEKIGAYEQALRVYLKASLHYEAARTYETIKDYTNAGTYYLRAGDSERAAACFVQGGDEKKSNEILSALCYKEGRLKEAALYAEKAGDLVHAAVIFAEAGEFREAGDLYERAGWFHEAGEIFLRMEDLQKATDAFEKAGNFALAARTYKKTGLETPRAAELFEKGGDYFEAGNLYLASGLSEKALGAYQMVPPGSDNYIRASLMVGKIFLKKGMLKLAFEKFKKIIGNETVNKSNIEAYYYLGICLESAGVAEKAKAVYGKVLAENYNFRDVKQRLERISKGQPRKPS